MGKGKNKAKKPSYELIRSNRSNPRIIDEFHKKFSPHTFVERELVRVAKLNENQRLFYKELQQYLADEREKRIEDIKSAIASRKKTDGSFNFSRIVTAKYANDPFNGTGSVVKPPGGRFNFGQSVSYNSYFIGIYFADSYDTAFAEKYHSADDEFSKDKLLDFSLSGPDSFSYVRAKIELNSYFDLTDDNSLVDFLEIIKEMALPDYIKQNAKKVGMSSNLLTNINNLKRALMDPYYTQSGIWLDQPAPSQWLGHYVRLAGLQGILYPSARKKEGVNLVVYPDNFIETDASIVLVDDSPYISQEKSYINKNNYKNYINLS